MTVPLISGRQWAQIRRKAALPQFGPALRSLHSDVQEFIARPVQVQGQPGGYYHDYFCPQHGLQLTFDPQSPTVHRCPAGGEVYSGEPFDAAWRWFVNDRLAQSALRLAILWQLEGIVDYRDQVCRILTDYADNYAGFAAFPPRTPNPGLATYTTLDESVWAIPLAWAFDMVRESLPEAEQRSISSRLWIPIAEHLVDHHFGDIHNFACWHNAAIGTLGLVSGRDDLLALAIDGPFGFHTQAREGVLADGLWFEGSFSYHFYTVAALLSLAKATANHPRWDLRSEEVLASVLRAPVLCAYPDGALPATNDCWYFTGLIDECCHGVPKAPAFYEIGFAWTRERLFGQVLARAYQQGPRATLDALLYGVPTLPGDGVPPLPSVHMPASGYAILRSQSAGAKQPFSEIDQQYLLLKYGPHGGGHGHPDKLSLTLYAHGARLSPDLGTPGYGIDLFERWYRRTISHNTVTLDGLSQPPGEGVANLFRAEGPFQIADASIAWGEPVPDAYRDVMMRRVVLVRPDYFLDLFLVDGEATHRIDWVYRNTGTLAPIPGSLPAPQTGDQGDGYDQIAEPTSKVLEDDVALSWQDGAVGLKAFLAHLPGTTVIAGHVPGNPPDDRHGMVLCRREASQTAFCALFHAHRELPVVADVTWYGRDLLGLGWTACVVECRTRRELWILRMHDQVQIPAWVAGLPADVRFEHSLDI